MTLFIELDDDTYIKYIEQAEFLHERGIQTQLSVIKLAELLYKKEFEKKAIQETIQEEI